jgi:hypothetical protein
MDENLIGFLLKTLDPDEQRAVEAHLRDHPEERARLERLRSVLDPLLAVDKEGPAPPPGLALGAIAKIAEYKCRGITPAPRPSPWQVEGPSPRRWARRADLLVAAALLLVVCGLAVPWLLRQWHEYQIRACQNNLRLFSQALNTYGETNADHFPKVEAQGPRSVAGIFVPMLNDAGLLGSDVIIGCPADVRRPTMPPKVGELEEMYRSRPAEFLVVAKGLAGSYAYSLGYVGEGKVNGLRRTSGDLLPILADRPPAGLDRNSPSHGGKGQNVLFIGGNVRWCTARTVGYQGDDIFLNKLNEVRAGINNFDTVLGASDATPSNSSLQAEPE